MTDHVQLDDQGSVTITLTRAQRRLLRNTFSASVQENMRDVPADPTFREFHAQHMVLLKSIVNILFDEPEYKALFDIPLDEPHVHLPV